MQLQYGVDESYNLDVPMQGKAAYALLKVGWTSIFASKSLLCAGVVYIVSQYAAHSLLHTCPVFVGPCSQFDWMTRKRVRF